MSKHEHIVEFYPGHDCQRFQCLWDAKGCIPGKGGSHGCSGVKICFVVKGKEGAVTFTILTDWTPQSMPVSDTTGSRLVIGWGQNQEVMPADLGYHSRKPMREGQVQSQKSCAFCDGDPCYYAGSGLNSYDAMYTLVNGGSEAVWEFLEGYYQYVYADGKYPKITEYPKPLRKF